MKQFITRLYGTRLMLQITSFLLPDYGVAVKYSELNDRCEMPCLLNSTRAQVSFFKRSTLYNCPTCLSRYLKNMLELADNSNPNQFTKSQSWLTLHDCVKSSCSLGLNLLFSDPRVEYSPMDGKRIRPTSSTDAVVLLVWRCQSRYREELVRGRKNSYPRPGEIYSLRTIVKQVSERYRM